MNQIEQLTNFILRKFVYLSYGNYEGMEENPSMEDLITLRGLAEEAICAKRKLISDMDNYVMPRMVSDD